MKFFKIEFNENIIALNTLEQKNFYKLARYYKHLKKKSRQQIDYKYFIDAFASKNAQNKTFCLN